MATQEGDGDNNNWERKKSVAPISHPNAESQCTGDWTPSAVYWVQTAVIDAQLTAWCMSYHFSLLACVRWVVMWLSYNEDVEIYPN